MRVTCVVLCSTPLKQSVFPVSDEQQQIFMLGAIIADPGQEFAPFSTDKRGLNDKYNQL